MLKDNKELFRCILKNGKNRFIQKYYRQTDWLQQVIKLMLKLQLKSHFQKENQNLKSLLNQKPKWASCLLVENLKVLKNNKMSSFRSKTNPILKSTN